MSSQPPAGPPIKKTNFDEVTSIVRVRHAKKSPDPEKITNKVIKLLPTALLYLLVTIFTALLVARFRLSGKRS